MLLIRVRQLESFEAELCYDIYFDHIVQSLIQLPGAIGMKKKNGKNFKIVLVLAIKLCEFASISDAIC